MESVKEEGSWHKIAFSLAEAMGLTEMRDKTHADQIATVDKSRKKAFQKAHKGEGRRSKAEINRAAMKRENQINRTSG